SRKFLPNAQALLAQLLTRGVRLGIISNTANLTRAQLTTHLPPDFDWGQFEPALVVLSSEVGVEKPDPAIFDKAVSMAGIDPTLCMYCSEDLGETLVAQQRGMRAARVQRPPNSDLNELLTELVKSGFVS